jgi:hypothetical protein
MRPVSRGYLTLDASDVRLDPWSVSMEGGGTLSSPESLDDWTYYQSLRIRTTVVADLGSVTHKLNLGENARLGLVIVWVSPGTSMRGASTVFPLEVLETSVELEINGGLLRGDLKLECQIVITRPSSLSALVAPSEVGAVVWSDSHSIRLEGIGSRMPVLAVPFSKHMAAAGGHAMWWLQVAGTDMHAPADSILWMWLNDENWMIQELLADPTSDGAERTRQFLKVDFYRQLIGMGIRDEDFDPADDFPTGSLGAVIAAPMGLLGLSIDELRIRNRHDPQLLEAEMQSRLGGL